MGTFGNAAKGTHLCLVKGKALPRRSQVPRSRLTMKHKLVAYLMRDNGQVSDMPTDELVFALDQLMQASTAQGQGMSSDIVAGYEFLQTVKLAMQTSKGRVSSETFVEQADTENLM